MIKATCKQCNKDFEKRQNKIRFCSRRCYFEHKKDFRHSEETKIKMSVSGKKAYAEGRNKPSFPMLGKHHSVETKKKLSEYFTDNPVRYWLDKSYPLKGELSPLWKEIKRQPLKEQIRKLFEYRQWRSDCMLRDDFTCQECGQRGGKLQVDHYLKTFALILRENNIQTIEEARDCEELWNINNGRTLCFGCHRNTDTYLKPLLLLEKIPIVIQPCQKITNKI